MFIYLLRISYGYFLPGVAELIVAVNKLDTCEWSQQRYDEICAILTTFLKKQAAFPSVHFVPLSGLTGANLLKSVSADHPLKKWYIGPTFIQLIGWFFV